MYWFTLIFDSWKSFVSDPRSDYQEKLCIHSFAYAIGTFHSGIPNTQHPYYSMSSWFLLIIVWTSVSVLQICSVPAEIIVWEDDKLNDLAVVLIVKRAYWWRLNLVSWFQNVPVCLCFLRRKYCNLPWSVLPKQYCDYPLSILAVAIQTTNFFIELGNVWLLGNQRKL